MIHINVSRFAWQSGSIGVGVIILTYVSDVLVSYSAIKQVTKMRKRILSELLNKDISWYDTTEIGDFASGCMENISKIEDGIGEKVALFLFYEGTFISGVLCAICLGWKLAFVCLISFPLTMLIMSVISWLSARFSKEEMEVYASAGTIAEEVLSAIRTVVAFHGQEKEAERYGSQLIQATQNNIRKHIFNGMSNGIMWLSVYACYALSFWYGIYLILEERSYPPESRTYTPGRMVSIFVCILFAFFSYIQGAPFYETFGVAKGAAARIFSILETTPKINLSKNMGKEPDEIMGHIKFVNVFFEYPSRPDVKVLQGLSLDIKAGETVALVGSSGSGKSTCIQLIKRFYDPSAGKVILDNNDIRELNLTWYRRNIGVVDQEPILFSGSIQENIRYGNPLATEEEIHQAARIACADQFIKHLPAGYDTIIGEKGVQLSGGQKQRIGIARALVKNPSILLLDEATSALDTTSEAEVRAAVNNVIGTRTMIIIAHRLTTVKTADKIIVLSEGRVVEEGNHLQLMKNRGTYYRLIKASSEEKATGSGMHMTVGMDMKDAVDIPLVRADKRSQDMKVQFSGEQFITTESSHTIDSEEELRETHSTENVSHMMNFWGYKETEEALKHYKSGRRSHLSEAEEEEMEKKTLLAILKENRSEWHYILLGCICSIVIGTSTPLYSIVFGDIIGLLSEEDEERVKTGTNRCCLYFVLLGVVVGMAYFLQLVGFGIAGEKLTFRLRKKLFQAMLRQEIGWFDEKENGVGALCSKLATDASLIQGAAGMRLGTILNSISIFVLANIVGFYLEWKLTCVLLSFAPLIFLAIWYEQEMQSKSDVTHLQKSSMIASEAVVNIRTVAALGAEYIFYEKYVKSLKPYVTSSKDRTHLRSLIVGGARSLPIFAYLVAVVYGVQLILEESMSYEVIYKIGESIIASAWSIGLAFAFSPNLHAGIEAARRIFKILGRHSRIQERYRASKGNWDEGDINYIDVHFTYPTRPAIQVLSGLSVSIFQGKTVALVGSSGCGKSTVIQLLQRFYDPNLGRITIGDEDIRALELESLRSHLGIVSQEPNLFDRTIAENIAYGANNREVSMSEIIEAAKCANIHTFVTELPLGYETRLGARGAQLSGGQKQRIAIARALIRNPTILLLDEATSALDNESEKAVQAALSIARENRTCITIAHRLSTIQDADLICVLSDGAIEEMGQHQELLDKKGRYFDFYKLQE